MLVSSNTTSEVAAMVKILLMSLSLASVCWAQNSKCSYEMDKKVLECSGVQKGFQVESFLTPTTPRLVIRNSDDLHFFSYYHNLTNYQNVIDYEIEDNGYLSIDPFAFCCMTNIRHLTIMGNYLPVVKDNSFRGLEQLKWLNLASNNITTLERNSFAGLASLKILTLSSNEIEHLTPNLFKDLTNLEVLFLTSNDIKTIGENCFLGLARLEALDLSYNKLRILKGNDFDVFSNLERLGLSYNNIEGIQGYLKLSKLTYLSLNNNKLRNIDNDAFKYLDRVEVINIDKNELSELTSHPFRNLSSLRVLNVKDNKLKKSDFDDLKHIIVVV